MSIERKMCLRGIEFKEGTNAAGIPVGYVSGYLATWDVDRVNDQFVKGCFVDAIAEKLADGKPWPLKDSHGRAIGIIPASQVVEDNVGLKITDAEINLEVQQGREAFSLVKQGAYGSWSIGFRAQKYAYVPRAGSADQTYPEQIRTITKSAIWEGSVCDIPANGKAVVTEAKSITDRSAMPRKYADRAFRLDVKAVDRVREWAGAGEEPNEQYASCFLVRDPEETGQFSGYKHLLADIVNGEPMIVPRAVFAARIALSTGKKTADIGEDAMPHAREVISRMYAEMGLDTPFTEDGNVKSVFVSEIKNMRKSDLTNLFKSGLSLSSDAASYVASSCIKNHTDTETLDGDAGRGVISELKKLAETINQSKEAIHGRSTR